LDTILYSTIIDTCQTGSLHVLCNQKLTNPTKNSAGTVVMSSLHQQSIPIFIKYLQNLSAFIQKGSKYADEKDFTYDDVLSYRLASDMQGWENSLTILLLWLISPRPARWLTDFYASLISQVQSCCNTVVGFTYRAQTLEPVAVEDNEKTFEQLHARIESTLAHLSKVDAHKLDDKVDVPVLIKTASSGTYRFASGQAYLSEYVIPNFHFHLTSAYCILRAQGMPLGFFDYFNDVLHKVQDGV
jgi:hypothetical protein